MVKHIITTIILTILAILGLGVYLIRDYITIESVSQQHHRIVIEDGETLEDKEWTELMGYNVKLNIEKVQWIGQ